MSRANPGRRMLVIAGVAVLIGAMTAPPGLARAPEPYSEEVSAEAISPQTSEECGFDVLVKQHGTVKGQVFFDGDGDPVRITAHIEFETTAERADGRSDAIVSGVQHFNLTIDPGDGTFKVAGLRLNFREPGAVEAGLVVLRGDEPIQLAGRFPEFAAVCEELAA